MTPPTAPPIFARTAEAAGPLLGGAPTAQGAWFEADSTPLLLLGAGGAVIDFNPAAEALMPAADWLTLSDGRLGLSGRSAQQALQRALADVVSGLASRAELVVCCADGGRRRLELAPTGSAPPHLVFLAIRADPDAPADVRSLAQCFGLTPAEADVLKKLADGLSPAETAALMGVAESTIRAHLRALYKKLKARGLQDLIRQAAHLSRPARAERTAS
jgi:DNA-binding CsgD family transcriptional regulator